MIPVYSEEEFNSATKMTKLPLRCIECGNTFYILKKEIERVLRGNRTYMFQFCNLICHGKHNSKLNTSIIKCCNCGKERRKTNNQIAKTKNHFCSRSCAATYNNTHKITGTRVSKLEKWLAEKLNKKYKKLEIHYNRKDAINSELDIYIPSLKLAFELNGIFHYEPIYGHEKLKQIHNNDDRKFQACLEKQIELVIIDVSKLKYFKLSNAQKYLDIIIEIINRKVPQSE